MAARPWTLRNGEVWLSVRLTPKAARDGIDGTTTLSDGSSVAKIRVRAVPEDGKANDALIRLVAQALDLPRSTIRLQSGATARTKVLAVSGDVQEIDGKLTAVFDRQT